MGLEWLSKFSKREVVRGHSGGPYTMMDVRGQPWAVVWDGTLAIYVRGQHGFPAAPERLEQSLRHYLARVRRFKVVRLADLKAFAGDPAWGKPCGRCQGTGSVECRNCSGTGECHCECRCGHWEPHDCWYCDGTGHLVCECQFMAEARVGLSCDDEECGWVAGVLINRTLLARTLDAFNDDEVAIWQINEGQSLCVQGDGWKVVLMGVSAGGRESTYPRFEAEVAQA